MRAIDLKKYKAAIDEEIEFNALLLSAAEHIRVSRETVATLRSEQEVLRDLSDALGARIGAEPSDKETGSRKDSSGAAYHPEETEAYVSTVQRRYGSTGR